MKTFNTEILKRNYKYFKYCIAISMMGLLSGCILTSPFWNQEFDDHTDPIPIQSWTVNKNLPVTIECSKAYHGGLYPVFSSGSWSNVTNLNPQLPGVLDPKGAVVYSAGRKMVLPENCWRKDPGNDLYYAAIRAKQGNSAVFSSFDNNGLECLGRWNGKLATWFGWAGKGCNKTYNNSNTPIPFVIFRAKM